jgi:nitroreductase
MRQSTCGKCSEALNSSVLAGTEPAREGPRALPYRVLRNWLALLIALNGLMAGAEELHTVALPPPQTEGGKPLMEALRQRRTVREFKPDKLPVPVLGSLLWAAFGVNRAETGGRTAPSAMNSQEVDIYVALAEGLYLYEPKAHQLKLVQSGDLRGKTSGQPFATNAPVTLLFVADQARLSKAKPEGRAFYADVDTGYISQNVYLFCASEGLGTVVHELDRAPLMDVLKLRPEQRIILAQAVGYPGQ